MKRILIVTTLLSFLIGKTALAEDYNLCIALNNFSLSTVEFGGLVDPGYVYTVHPKESKTLVGDHMYCLPNGGGCAVQIYALDGSTPKGIIIKHLPRGTRIIYGGADQYYLDVNAKVKCGT